jgi:hypothetical protein
VKEDSVAAIRFVSRSETVYVRFGKIFGSQKDYMFVDFSDSSKIAERYYDYEKI